MIRGAKLPDFTSRLKGYVDVLGPNQRRDESGEAVAGDKYYILRRAILLRGMLQRDAAHVITKGELKIDSGVLRAMLETRVYKHGARSMESVIAIL